jgi:hypothetical protein
MDDSLHHARGLDSTLHAIVELSGGDVKRRGFLSGAVFTAAAFAEPALLALTAPPVASAAGNAGTRRIGMTDVEILTDKVAHLRQMDLRYGSGQMRGRVVQLLHQEATTLLHGSYSDSTGRALLTAVAQAARLAASTAVDVGRPAELGRALRDIGEPAHAIRSMTHTLDSYEPWQVRSRCLAQVDLAAAYLIDGDDEHAAALVRDALNTAGEVSSSRTVRRIQSLQQQIRPLQSKNLTEVDEQITAFLRSSHGDEDLII